MNSEYELYMHHFGDEKGAVPQIEDSRNLPAIIYPPLFGDSEIVNFEKIEKTTYGLQKSPANFTTSESASIGI